MIWPQQVYLIAGVGALLLGGGVWLRDPRRPRHRRFALLCLALATWTLGIFGRTVDAGRSGFPWQVVFMAGSSAAGPLGLHFALVAARRTGALRRVVLPTAYVAAAGLWIGAWFQPASLSPPYQLASALVLSPPLMVALAVLVSRLRELRPGPERSAIGLVLLAGAVAVFGGLSDFIPRVGAWFPRIGPVAVLFFLFIVCAIVVRHRFLDVSRFLLGAVAIGVGAAVMALVFFSVARLTGGHYFPLLVAALVLLPLSGLLGRTVLGGLRSLELRNPLIAPLSASSDRLTRAESERDLWSAVALLEAKVPSNPWLVVHFDDGASLVPRYASSHAPQPGPLPRDHPLAVLLGRERQPLTRTFLERELHDVAAGKRGPLRAALEPLDTWQADIVVPLLAGDRLRGVLSSGGIPASLLTAEVGAAFLAVANQAMAALERIVAVERARQREALAAVGEMAAALAHEVRNPVAAIRGAAQTLDPAGLDDSSRDMVQVIEEETGRLGRVVGEFLDYARPHSPRRETVDVERLAQRVLAAAQIAGQQLDWTVETVGPPISVPADPDQLARVIANLARNAWENGGDGVRFEVTLRHADDATIELRFEDDGPGIEESLIPSLFLPFRSQRPSGLGLGLALVARIVEEHGGSISVDGRPGVGAVFTLTLPRKLQDG